jgi:hypothetical protein
MSARCRPSITLIAEIAPWLFEARRPSDTASWLRLDVDGERMRYVGNTLAPYYAIN